MPFCYISHFIPLPGYGSFYDHCLFLQLSKGLSQVVNTDLDHKLQKGKLCNGHHRRGQDGIETAANHLRALNMEGTKNESGLIFIQPSFPLLLITKWTRSTQGYVFLTTQGSLALLSKLKTLTS